MKNKEDHPSFIGVFKVPNYKGEAGNKVLNIFNRLKRKAEQVPHHSSAVIPVREIQPNMQELGYSAMNSYRLHPDVIKTDSGFEIV